MYQSFKYRLTPTQGQADIFQQWVGCKRFIWNKALALSLTRLENKHFVPKFFELNKILTLWKKAEEWQFLKEPPKDVLQCALMDLDKAFTKFWKGQARLPKFKKKYDDRQSFRIAAQSIRLDNNKIWLPKIKQWVPFRRSRKVKGDIRSVTVSFDGYHWFVSFLCKVPEREPIPFSPVVGIDMGIAIFAALSDGGKIKALSFTKEVARLVKAQQKMARRVKGSNNWSKAETAVRKQYTHIANKRKDYIEKETTKLASSSLVAVEALKIGNMSKSAKGNAENHGKNVAQKRGLNRAILTQGWGMFTERLKQKVEANKGIFVKVDPKFTSQECSDCGQVSKANRQSQSVFKCVSCGYSVNADVNAASNILARGLRVSGLQQGDNHVFG